jgi:hypothetical protein
MALVARSDAPATIELLNADTALASALERHKGDPDFWSSKSRDRSDSAHCIFQYPAMMVPVVQRRLLAAVVEAQPLATDLWDPFVGSGTSLVSAMHFGMNVFGNDINPLAVLISRTRTARTIEFSIAQVAERTLSEAKADRKTKIETELPNLEKWFKPEVVIELSRLRRAIRKCESLWARRFMWVTLAETVRLTSNDRTSTYKLHARPLEEIGKRDLSPFEVFSDLAVQNAKSFAAFRGALRTANQLKGISYIAKSEIQLADSRGAPKSKAAPEQGFHLLMTSPPYGDNRTTVTYGQHSYLPLNWIDFSDIDEAADSGALVTTHEIDRRSLGGPAPIKCAALEKLYSAAPSLQRFAEDLPASPADARKRLHRFYLDFQESLVSINDRMAPNGYMIWTVGNRSLAGSQVPTDKILAELFESLGCTLVTTLTRTIHHKRMAKRNASSSTMGEEHILLLRTAS